MASMRAFGLAGFLVWPLAWLVAWVTGWLVPGVLRIGRWIALWPPLKRLHDRVGRLPVGIALPLFLVPELCSRSGWLVSAWLLLHGHPGRAIVIYVVTKLIAGSLALWVCSACLPALLRVRAFAAVHKAAMDMQHTMRAWAGQHAGSRFSRTVAELRSRWVRPGSSTPAPGSATPSAPADPSRIG